jgi:hypothetical protein
MPFGVSTAPRVFAKSLAPVIAEVRKRYNCKILAYADDILLLHQDRSVLQAQTLQIKTFLESFGWIISDEKSSFNPS